MLFHFINKKIISKYNLNNSNNTNLQWKNGQLRLLKKGGGERAEEDLEIYI